MQVDVTVRELLAQFNQLMPQVYLAQRQLKSVVGSEASVAAVGAALDRLVLDGEKAVADLLLVGPTVDGVALAEVDRCG